MGLTGLQALLRGDPVYGTLAGRAASSSGDGFHLSAPSGIHPAVLGEIVDGLRRRTAGAPSSPAKTDGVQGEPSGDRQPITVAIVATSRAAEDLAQALSCYLEPTSFAIFPSWETLPHERLSPRSETMGARLEVLRRLASDQQLQLVIAPIRAVLQPLASGLEKLRPVTVALGQTVPFDDVIAQFVAAAYTRVDMVTRRGEFAVRGGIIDVFPATGIHPVRIEFFGDEVESLRWFSVADQRSLSDEHPTEVTAPPCRELLLTPQVRERAQQMLERLPAAADMLAKLAEGVAVEGMESLTAVLVDEMVPFLSYVPAGSLSLLAEPERVKARAHDLEATNTEFLQAAWSSASDGGQAPIDMGAALAGATFSSLADIHRQAQERRLSWWTLSSLGAQPSPSIQEEGAESAGSDEQGENAAVIDAREPAAYQGDVQAMLDYLGQRLRPRSPEMPSGSQREPQPGSLGASGTDAPWRYVVTTAGPGPAQRLAELFHEAQLPVQTVESVDTEPPAGAITITTAQAGYGFVLDHLRLGLLTEADLLGRARVVGRPERKLSAKRRRNAVDPLQLSAGDYVVHEQHGIGRFVELASRPVPGGGSREYVVLEYAPSKRAGPRDRLFVPTDQLDAVSAYVGGDSPALSKMGGSDWAATKGRARKAVKEIAGELIRLYSARQASKGHAFAPDTPWQAELEAAFPYVETPDQLTAIDDVKADMERDVPMDRLISGDVGFGKTEIAVRAAFKAVQDGKQVAVLVPTTLLAQQHEETFSERFSGFPVRVRTLSRFQTAGQARQVLQGLSEGTVDVVIGTHRLLGKEVQFKDLGLIIVDEEQRFGVEHKEKLKTLRTNVDVLAMSATPIPRTLEMSLTGIRETSTLATAPEERHPVLTSVTPYADKQVAAAIHRELLREGQVFYVHNRVSSIERTAGHVRELVPEARVEVAHGQMSESRLEQIMLDFWHGRFDVLVSTTIIETGLDISNANTLIVDRCDRYGLSQLHQLRGRVGRGRERAYAYFLYDPEKPLGDVAFERLKAVAAHNELGAGLQLAMKDLEIRGAGNLLGGEQSGHISGVGFDLYVRMVSEAVADFRGDEQSSAPEVSIELPIDAHLPHDYVPSEQLRLEGYRKLAAATSGGTVDDVLAEWVDRYGAAPEPVLNLAALAQFRLMVVAAGLSEVALQGPMVRFGPLQVPESVAMRVKRLYPGAVVKSAAAQVLVPRPKSAPVGGQPLVGLALLEWVKQVLAELEPARVS